MKLSWKDFAVIFALIVAVTVIAHYLQKLVLATDAEGKQVVKKSWGLSK